MGPSMHVTSSCTPKLLKLDRLARSQSWLLALQGTARKLVQADWWLLDDELDTTTGSQERADR